MLEALALIDNRAGIKLRIIGGGIEEPRLRGLSERLHLNELVEFLGPVPNDDLPAWYQNSSMLVFPSIATSYGDQEGFGLVPAEALACGCAVIASDLPAVRDVIQDNKTGLLVTPGSSRAIASAVELLLSDPDLRTKLSRQGRRFVVENLDWSIISNKYNSILEQLAKNKHKN
jgi:glycosyltransferase involved in cell wall biosynthesis